MATIVPVQRKSAVLKRPALPCLSRWYTVNLLAGCPYDCRYCYARSFRSNPGADVVHFYANTLDLLRHELPRKRIKPDVVYFSTACEPFIPDQAVQETLHDVMRLLLVHGITLLISTKSSLPDRFLELFASFPNQVFVQVGLTTVDDNIRRVLEPRAGTVEERLRSLESLCAHGIRAEVRMDPLIPELTDRIESLESLCRQIATCGATTASASYLFLRDALWSSMQVDIGDWSFRDMAERSYTHTIEDYCGHSAIQVPDARHRIERYAALKQIAARQGIALRLCCCKNPDLTQECCHPPLGQRQPSQLNLDLGETDDVRDDSA